MIERQCHKPPQAVILASKKQAPVLVMTIRIANQRIQHRVLRKSTFRSTRSFRLFKNVVHSCKDIRQCMLRLVEFFLGIVTANGPLQYLVAVI